ncbi:MAG: pilin [Proteobacteria bacterium]|nr:pilin [Pseudomonadota bacterium]
MRLITAILIPAQQDYKIREKVSEGAILGDGSKTAMAEFYSNKNSFPSANASAGVATATRIVGNYGSNATDADGQVTVMKEGRVLTFKPAGSSGSTTWACTTASGSTVSAKYRPTICRP